MKHSEKVLDAFLNCITEPKCLNCPWGKCSEVIQDHVEIPRDLAAEVNTLLQRYRGAEAEIEGGEEIWWFVCGECRKILDPKDKYCRQCGREIIWT